MVNNYEKGIALGRDISPSLEHRAHKYIKREWKNGRWRYYYDDNANRLSQLQAAQKRTDDLIEREYGKHIEAARSIALKENSTGKTGEDNINRYMDGLKTSSGSNIAKAYKNFWLEGKSTRALEKNREINRYSRKSIMYAKQRSLRESRASRAEAVEKRSKSLGGKVDKFMQKNGSKVASAYNAASDVLYANKKKFTGAVGSLANRYRIKKKK